MMCRTSRASITLGSSSSFRLITAMVVLFGALLVLTHDSNGDDDTSLTASDIMREVISRNGTLIDTYEELVMVSVDGTGNRDSLKMRRYTRTDDNIVRNMLLLDYPIEIRGVAFLSKLHLSGSVETDVYLPAVGDRLFRADVQSGNIDLFDTNNFLIDMISEVPGKYIYKWQQPHLKTDYLDYYGIDVYTDTGSDNGGCLVKRHFIHQKNYYIYRTDYFAQCDLKNPYISLTRSDFYQIDKRLWLANIYLIKDLRDHHSILVKVSKRILSRDYVPEEIFNVDQLFKRYSTKKPADQQSGHETDSESTTAPIVEVTVEQDN